MAERRVVSNCEGSLKKSPEMASRGSNARQRGEREISSHARRGCACARRPVFCSPMPNGGIHEAGEEAEQKRYEVAQDHARMDFYSPWKLSSRGASSRG